MLWYILDSQYLYVIMNDNQLTENYVTIFQKQNYKIMNKLCKYNLQMNTNVDNTYIKLLAHTTCSAT